MTPEYEIGSIDSKLKSLQASARRIKDDEHAYGIWGDLVHVTSRINALLLQAASSPGGARPSSRAVQPAPGLTSKLQGWIQRIKSALDALAKFLKAASYSVGVSAPIGISVAITFGLVEAQEKG
jgi:hypothetical protein